MKKGKNDAYFLDASLKIRFQKLITSQEVESHGNQNNFLSTVFHELSEGGS